MLFQRVTAPKLTFPSTFPGKNRPLNLPKLLQKQPLIHICGELDPNPGDPFVILELRRFRMIHRLLPYHGRSLKRYTQSFELNELIAIISNANGVSRRVNYRSELRDTGYFEQTGKVR